MIKLFTTETCPKCAVLKQKLNMKNIAFEETHELQEVIDLGFRSAPVLFDGQNYLDFKEANAYVNSL